MLPEARVKLEKSLAEIANYDPAAMSWEELEAAHQRDRQILLNAVGGALERGEIKPEEARGYGGWLDPASIRRVVEPDDFLEILSDEEQA